MGFGSGAFVARPAEDRALQIARYSRAAAGTLDNADVRRHGPETPRGACMPPRPA
jgi:hypothetical protein